MNEFNLTSRKKDEYFNTDYLRSGLKGRAVKGAGATVFSQGLVFCIQMAGTIILARLLTPVDFGLVTMVTTVSLLLQNFGINGFTEVVIQKEDINHKQVSTLFWINAISSIVLALFFVFMAPVLVWFYKEPRLAPVVIAISISIVLTGLSTQHLALLKRTMRFYSFSSINIAARAISICSSIILAWRGWGFWALVVGNVVLALTTTAGSWIVCRWRPGLPDIHAGIKPMIKFALNTYGNFSMNYFTRNLDNVLVGWRYGSQSLGFYKKAYDLFILPMGQLSAPLTSVFLAALSRLRTYPDKYRLSYLKAISMLAFVGMPLSAFLTLIGHDLIVLILGPQWNNSGVIFSYFAPSIGIILIYGTNGWLHLSLGRADRWFRWGIVEVIFTALFLIVGLQFGAIGVAIAYTASSYCLLCPGLWYAGRPINLSISSIICAIWKYYIAALVAGLLCWFMLYSLEMNSNKFIGSNLSFRVVFVMTSYVLLYMLLIVILHHGIKPIIEFISIVRDMIPNRRYAKVS